MTGHSPLGASAAKRWSNCPGSVREIAKLPEHLRNYESEYAKEGTAMHEAAALALRTGLQAEEFVGRMFGDVEITGELAEYIQEYVDAVRFSHEMNGGNLLIEHAVAAPELHKDAYGTLDAAVESAPLAHIFDLKGGEGLVVEVEGNDQFRQYAWTRYHNKPEFTEFVLTVSQPQREHEDGTLRSETLTRAELQAWAETHMLPAMRRTEDPNAPLADGEWCRFCPVNKALACKVTKRKFEVLTCPPPKTEVLSDEALVEQLKLVPAARFYMAALLEERDRRMLKEGKKLPGFLVMRKKSDRVFRDQVEWNGEQVGLGWLAQHTFGQAAMTEPKLKSPAQMEKIKHPDAKDFVAKYAYKPETGFTVVEDDGKKVGVDAPKPEERYAHLAKEAAE